MIPLSALGAERVGVRWGVEHVACAAVPPILTRQAG